jgi:hypothetical protein
LPILGLNFKKQKDVIGGLSAEAQLIAYFDEQRTKVLEVEKEVERVDREIEELVRGCIQSKNFYNPYLK